jgi:hypothetical protein
MVERCQINLLIDSTDPELPSVGTLYRIDTGTYLDIPANDGG